MVKKRITSFILGIVFIFLIFAAIFSFMRLYFVNKDINAGFIKVGGRIEGREYHAATKVSGRVDEIPVEEGDEVKAGQVIARIYSQQLEAALAASQARLRQAEADFKLAEIEYKRYARLYQGRAIAKMEYDYIDNKYKRAAEELFVAEKNVDKAKADLEDTRIIAPISGVIVTKVVREGEVVSAGTSLVTIINMDDLYLKIFLSTELSGKVNIKDEAKIFPDALPGEEFVAYVKKISGKAEFTPKNVETKDQRAKLVFEIEVQAKENKGHKLKPGMPAEGVIKINKDASWGAFKI